MRPAPWRRLYATLRRESIDVVHAHMPRASVPGSILARLARVPVVISHEHGSAITGKRIRPFLDRHVVARLSTVILVVSDWDRRQLIELERIPAERIAVLPNGIVTPPEAGPDVRPGLGLSDSDRLIGAVGRLYPREGLRRPDPRGGAARRHRRPVGQYVRDRRDRPRGASPA